MQPKRQVSTRDDARTQRKLIVVRNSKGVTTKEGVTTKDGVTLKGITVKGNDTAKKRLRARTAKSTVKTYDFSSLGYVEPSFIRGVARVLDVGHALDTSIVCGRTPEEVDMNALRADQQAVLSDYRQVRSRMLLGRPE